MDVPLPSRRRWSRFSRGMLLVVVTVLVIAAGQAIRSHSLRAQAIRLQPGITDQEIELMKSQVRHRRVMRERIEKSGGEVFGFIIEWAH